VNASQLTTLIVAECGNVTDTFLLRCFLSDLSTQVNLLSDTPAICDNEQREAASSCQILSDWNVVSQQSLCRALNQCYRLASVHHTCTSDEMSMSLPLSCAQQWSSADCSDTSVLLPVIADNAVSHGATGACTVRGCEPTVSCGRMSQSEAKYCSRIIPDNHTCTAKSYRLEHLDISGCWKITDLSIRSA